MPLKSCHRTHDTRELCRYLGRMTDVECHRCVLAKANPPERRASSWWSVRAEREVIKAETRIKTNNEGRKL